MKLDVHVHVHRCCAVQACVDRRLHAVSVQIIGTHYTVQCSALVLA